MIHGLRLSFSVLVSYSHVHLGVKATEALIDGCWVPPLSRVYILTVPRQILHASWGLLCGRVLFVSSVEACPRGFSRTSKDGWRNGRSQEHPHRKLGWFPRKL